jgi:N-glycosylase/DNA lyase
LRPQHRTLELVKYGEFGIGMVAARGAESTATQLVAGQWRDLGVSASRLRLAPTLLTGMSFRWRRHAHGDDCVFAGVLGADAYELRETEASVEFRLVSAKPSAGAEARLRAHLSLDRGLDVCEWHARVQDPPECFARACAALGGVRVLHINSRLEALVTFVGSANNNIKRNMQMVEALCAHFAGARIETLEALDSGDGASASADVKPLAHSQSLTPDRNSKSDRSTTSEHTPPPIPDEPSSSPEPTRRSAPTSSTEPTARAHYRFPTVAELCSLSEQELWALGWGYRAPRLHKLARQLEERGGERFLDDLERVPEAEARAALCELCGVGRKVADCILLFSYGRGGCVPVDTHCLQLAQTRLLPAIKGLSLTAGVYERIVARFHELFGEEYAGWAFMVGAALLTLTLTLTFIVGRVGLRGTRALRRQGGLCPRCPVLCGERLPVPGWAFMVGTPRPAVGEAACARMGTH